MITDDYEDWLEAINLESLVEIESVYQAASELESTDLCEVTKSKGNIILSVPHHNEKLVLSPQNCKKFISCLRKDYMENTDDSEMWIGFQKKMDDPKA
jgi:hypothetical protein